MPGSSDKGKATVLKWFNALPCITSVMDIGPGWGTYVKMLRQGGQTWHALEVFEPYVAKFGLDHLYDQIFVADVRTFNLTDKYDVIICGDVLEHMLNYEAVKVLTRLLPHCRYMIVSLPLDDETNVPKGTGDVDWKNIYELHKGRWTHEQFQSVIGRLGARIVEFDRFPEIAVYLIEPIQERLINEDAVETPFISSQAPDIIAKSSGINARHIASCSSAPGLKDTGITLHNTLSFLSRGFSRILKRQHVFINKAQSGENIDIDTIENWHEAFIEHLASVLKPRVYVELGLYRCELFNRIIPYAQRLIGVDIAAEAGKWVTKSDKVQFVNSTTDEFATALQARPMSIDMLFIDADHSKEAVLKDFWNLFPFVSRHGLIILHDTHPKNIDYTQPGYCVDAYKAIEELSKYTDKFEMMTIPVHPGLTLCRKRATQLSWMETGV